MKNKRLRMLSVILVFISLFLSFNVMPALATTTGTDAKGFTWQSDDGITYSITGYNGSDTNITIPSSIDGHTVTSIANNAFKNKALTNVIIPDTVTSIGGFAFYYCSSLVNISIPNSVTSIGDSAFAYCTSLPSITLPTNLSNIGNCTFQDCKAFTGITIPDSVKSIGIYAFLECNSLASITIPSGVTSIGEGAFKDCKSLKSVIMPDSVTSVGNYLFYNCQLLSIVRLSNNLTDTGTFIFYNCFALTGVTLPSNLKNIGNSSFENCTALTNITIPNGVVRIGYRAFIMCKVLQNITIPNTVKTIDFNAFAHCYSFTNITIPDSVTSIGDYAFYYCTSLTGVTIPQSVTSIGFLTFNSCNSDFKIKGIPSSYAQGYAVSNSIPFQELYITKNTVAFNSQGGSIVGNLQVDNNNLITAPTSPTKTGYTFGGWYKELACITPWNFTTDKVTNNMTLFAKWITNPAIPTNIKAISTGYDAISTSWNQVTLASGYEIWRSTSSTGTYNLISKTTSTNYSDTGLVVGTSYYYKVRAYTMVGNVKAYSNFTSIVGAKPILGVPKVVPAVSSSYNSINTSWGLVPGASGYEIWRSTSDTGIYSLVGTVTGTVLSYNNVGLVTGTTYYYKIRAYRLVGQTKIYGNYATIVSAKVVPLIPANCKAVRTNSTSITTSWNPVVGATAYDVYRATSSNGVYSLVKVTTSLSFVNTGLIKGNTYYYKVKAYRVVGQTKVCSDFTNVVYAKTY
ncbi:Listeria/Bacterioides repeat-containing protein [Clostridium cavendishii DSM 21758]|uniref:Listeria/Bacterioides repeat-containing protein n=1 Tax=Clostridium cavendishii DSM 21758 TaxID=1121302 RepID=A0A1M6GQY9_9CLOT|nr:leucine-rich repeat protein [Clostridium cavendishii]SHJ12322.1 Listeria/Bacterioides repeat-containing protein [Clostridium cavendishii DSM 21758]